ncbi:MAG: dolichol-P-glucose synthetase [Parcubacteria group bacterium]|nr:dolichol-P-glucose synthetase [Parcubacteria group bacterium]
MVDYEFEVSIVMPCLNEEETIGICVEKAIETMKKYGIKGEVVVIDNGSTDKSVQIAESLGARVLSQPVRGYGNAYIKGLTNVRGRYIVMGDSDDSYDFTDIERFVVPLRDGYDMVMGTRLKGEIKKGAMPWLHRYVGNPVLSGFLNVLFKTGISDAHCGMRSFTKSAFEKMHLSACGMEFASEMVINASKANLKIKEIPITLYPHGRSRRPHLRSFRDGWRHIRLMLIYSPTYLFLLPGIAFFFLGMSVIVALLGGPVYIGGHGYDVHVMVVGSLLAILGFQTINLGLYAKAISYTEEFYQVDNVIKTFYNIFTLERGLYFGLLFFSSGSGLMIYLLLKFLYNEGFSEMRLAILGMTLIVVGVQTIFSSFLLSMLNFNK